MSATVNDLQDLSAISWPLRTARLTIRPSCPEDADALFEYRSLPDVAEWLPVLPTDRAEWAERFAAPERLACTLIAEVDTEVGTEVVGDLYLQLRDGWAQAEVKEQARNSDAALGWAIAPAHTGRGYATEAAAELVRACFEDLGVRRVVAEAYADNHASRRIMDKLGMRQEQHTVKESLHRTRGWLDGVSYALLVEEWRAVTR